jgi:hypothetical protein
LHHGRPLVSAVASARAEELRERLIRVLPVLQAIDAKDKDKLLEVGDGINQACENGRARLPAGFVFRLNSMFTSQSKVGRVYLFRTSRCISSASVGPVRCVPRVSSSNASVITMLASIGEFESQTDHTHVGAQTV